MCSHTCTLIWPWPANQGHKSPFQHSCKALLPPVGAITHLLVQTSLRLEGPSTSERWHLLLSPRCCLLSLWPGHGSSPCSSFDFLGSGEIFTVGASWAVSLPPARVPRKLLFSLVGSRVTTLQRRRAAAHVPCGLVDPLTPAQCCLQALTATSTTSLPYTRFSSAYTPRKYSEKYPQRAGVFKYNLHLQHFLVAKWATVPVLIWLP